MKKPLTLGAALASVLLAAGVLLWRAGALISTQ